MEQFGVQDVHVTNIYGGASDLIHLWISLPRPVVVDVILTEWSLRP